MDLLNNLALGAATALSLANLFYAFVGCLLGTLIGVLPGIGPLATIAMLLPLTYALSPTSALIMLAGIYYGAQYGGSTTAIVVNLPGESSSVVTTIDGHQMARQGGPAWRCRRRRSVPSLPAASPLSSSRRWPRRWRGRPPLPAEGIFFADGARPRARLRALDGPVPRRRRHGGVRHAAQPHRHRCQHGALRFAFGIPQLFDGVDFVPLALGIFGFAEIVKNLEPKDKMSLVTSRSRTCFRHARIFDA